MSKTHWRVNVNSQEFIKWSRGTWAGRPPAGQQWPLKSHPVFLYILFIIKADYRFMLYYFCVPLINLPDNSLLQTTAHWGTHSARLVQCVFLGLITRINTLVFYCISIGWFRDVIKVSDLAAAPRSSLVRPGCALRCDVTGSGGSSPPDLNLTAAQWAPRIRSGWCSAPETRSLFPAERSKNPARNHRPASRPAAAAAAAAAGFFTDLW